MPGSWPLRDFRMLTPDPHPTDEDPSVGAPVFRERLRAAMRIPVIEALFPVPWTVAARRVLPSPSPQFTATAMWGPVLAWCVLELLAESIDAENPEPVALDLFDRLRLREPFAQAFAALGFEGEEAWRVAARIKVLLLSAAGVGKPHGEPGEAEPAVAAETPDAESAAPIQEPAADELPPGEQGIAVEERVALSPELWLDPDVRWLCGVHQTQGHSYLVREPYEELLWWLLMPSLLRMAGEPAFNRKAAGEMSKTVEETLATAETAGYRIDALLGDSPAPDAAQTAEPEVESRSTEPEQAQIDPEEPSIKSPAVSAVDSAEPSSK